RSVWSGSARPAAAAATRASGRWRAGCRSAFRSADIRPESMSCRKGEPTPPAYQHSSVVSDYFAHCEAERRRRYGDWGRVTGSPGEVFPNTALHPRQPRTIAVWHPRGAHQTEVWRWYLVDAAAPSEAKAFLRDYYIRYSGPAGLTEQDDMENWNYAHAASRGTIA